ncbi:hypothetical protein GCM10027261_18800 [Geodermatophilus arenarius]
MTTETVGSAGRSSAGCATATTDSQADGDGRFGTGVLRSAQSSASGEVQGSCDLPDPNGAGVTRGTGTSRVR